MSYFLVSQLGNVIIFVVARYITRARTETQKEPSYLVRGLFGNYLFLADLDAALIPSIGELGGVKYVIPLRLDEGVRQGCERVFKRFGAHVLCQESFEVDAPRVDPSAWPAHAERCKIEYPNFSSAEEGRPDGRKRIVCAFSLKGAQIEYPLATLRSGRTALPATWPGDSRSLAHFLAAQPTLCEAYEVLTALFEKENVLVHRSPRHLAFAIYDDCEYDLIDYDTMDPDTRRTLSTLLSENGATQKRGGQFEFQGADLRMLKSPKTLSSPVIEGLSLTKDAIYLLTPTQLAALIAQDPESHPEELATLAQALPYNLEKLLLTKEQLPLLKHVDRARLRTILRQCGAFYRARRQRGIRGRLPSAPESDSRS